jgi:uncharacterized protein
MNTTLKTARFVLAVACVGAVSASCGLNMEKNYLNMRPFMAKGDWAGAAAYVETKKEDFYGKDNRVLYYVDKGYTLHMAGQYEQSNEFLDKAAKAVEELWTESVSANAAALLTTDNALPYQGEDFEKVLINIYAALNYAALGKWEDARVEARVVSQNLDQYNSKYEDKKNAYKDDAFIRWFSAWLRETEAGDDAGLDDAKIDYAKAVELYQSLYNPTYKAQVPEFVVQDLFRVAEFRGMMDTIEEIRKAFPNVTWPKYKEVKEKGEILFIHENGESPFKRDKFVEAKAGTDTIRVAFPEFVAKQHRITYAVVKVEGSDVSAQTVLMEPITAIALQNLDDRMGRIMAKAIARAVAKFIASKAAQEGGKAIGGTAGAALQLGGAIFGAASNAMEEADKRSWITLPSDIWVGRLRVDPGKYNLAIEYHDGNGNVVKTKKISDIEVGKAGKKIVLDRTFE